MSKDDATWLRVAYAAFGLLMYYVFYKALETVGIQTGWGERFEWFAYAETLGGIALAVACTWYLMMDKERHDYLLASVGELRKVTWPTWADTKRMTVIVGIVVGIFAVILGAFDFVWSQILKRLVT
jgi:preprotein translocase subunit SecE